MTSHDATDMYGPDILQFDISPLSGLTNLSDLLLYA